MSTASCDGEESRSFFNNKYFLSIGYYLKNCIPFNKTGYFFIWPH